MGRPKRRRMGQNFLKDPTFARRIVDLLAEKPPRILEIGPGRGALTLPLAEIFPRILALELDKELIPALRRDFEIDILHGDALEVDLDELLGSEAPWQLAANLPYSVGTAILRRLMPRHDLVRRMVVMLQKEVIGRLLATPAGRGHGFLALLREAYADAWFAFDVPPGAFRPRPKVESAVAVLDLHPPEFSQVQLEAAFSLASHALTRPRKALTGALKPLADAGAIQRAGLDPSLRPGMLSLADWVSLAKNNSVH